MRSATASAQGSTAADAGQPLRANAQGNEFAKLWAACFRQRWLLAGSVILALALGVVAILLLPKKWQAVSSVQIEQQTPQILSADALDPEPQDSARFLQTQIDRVRSRSLTNDVIALRDIAGSPEILGALGVEAGDDEALIKALREAVLPELGLDTRLAQITVETRNPDVSASLANAYAEALIAENLRGKTETSGRAQEYLLDQLEEAKAKLEQSERRLLGYARSAELTGTALPDAAMGSEPAQQLAQLTSSLAAATARRIDAQQQWNQVRSAPPETLAQVQENRAYQELLAERARLQSALAEDRQRHTDEYPSVIATRAQIAQIGGEIERLSANIRQSFEQQYRAAARQEAQLQATTNALRGASMAEQERGVGYNSLQREVDINRVTYDGLLQRYRDVSAAAGAPAANILLVDRAEPPLDPSSPNTLFVMAIAGIAGLIIGLALALLREQLTAALRTVEDVEAQHDLSVLGVIPVLARPATMMEALRETGSAQTEAYNSTAAALQHAAGGAMARTILVTSSQAHEGKSTSTLGIARGLRTLGYRVLVVNGDLRKPSREHGFAELLAGKFDTGEMVSLEKRNGLAVLPAGDAAGNPMGLLAPDRVKRVLDKLAVHADIVLIDGPPILGLADAPLLASSVDAVLMIVEAGRTTSSQLGHALARLPVDVPTAGLLTKFDARKAGVSYGDTAYYTYGEKDAVPGPA